MRLPTARWLGPAWALVAACLCAQAAAQPFVMGTSQPEDTYAGKLQRRIYREAFRRLDIPLQISVLPLQRLTIVADQGAIDGDVARTHGYAANHPDLVRVEEPVYDSVWALFAVNPTLELDALPSLANRPWRATYLRGVGICERALKPLVPPERLSDVTSDTQGFTMMRLGRTDVHCTADLSAINLQYTAEFSDLPITRKVAEIGSFPLHPYVHRKHADLAPRLATVLRQMKADGLLERYRQEAFREVERR